MQLPSIYNTKVVPDRACDDHAFCVQTAVANHMFNLIDVLCKSQSLFCRASTHSSNEMFRFDFNAFCNEIILIARWTFHSMKSKAMMHCSGVVCERMKRGKKIMNAMLNGKSITPMVTYIGAQYFGHNPNFIRLNAAFFAFRFFIRKFQ